MIMRASRKLFLPTPYTCNSQLQSGSHLDQDVISIISHKTMFDYILKHREERSNYVAQSDEEFLTNFEVFGTVPGVVDINYLLNPN